MKYPLLLGVEDLTVLRFHVAKFIERKETDEALSSRLPDMGPFVKQTKQELRDLRRVQTLLEGFAKDIVTGKVGPVKPTRAKKARAATEDRL